MSPRLKSVREACETAAELRTEEQVLELLEFVKDVAFLSELTHQQLLGLCRGVSLEEFGPRETVFKHGSRGEKFYVILSGSVLVQVPEPSPPCPLDLHEPEECNCPGKVARLQVRGRLDRGSGFGEMALQSEQPRAATITANERTELLVIRRKEFERCAGQRHRHFVEVRVKFLQCCPRIQEALSRQLVSPQDVEAMAACLTEQQLTGSALACRQGEPADRMIFVRTGQLLMVRTVDLQRNRELLMLPRGAVSHETRSTQALLNGNLRSPRRQLGVAADGPLPAHLRALFSAARAAEAPVETPRAGGRKRLLRVGAVGPCQYFGDRELCRGAAYPVSLVSEAVTEIYVMSKHDILRRLPKKMLAALFIEETESFLPPDEQLLQMARQNERWEGFRRGMHAEALSARSQPPLRGRRAAADAARVAENLEFLGTARQVLPLPARQQRQLSEREQAHFSEAPSQFLRQLRALKQDPGLRQALGREGRQRLGEIPSDEDDDSLSFWSEEYWSKLVTDPVGLDIDAALRAEEAPRPRGTGAMPRGSLSARRHARLPSLQSERLRGAAA